MRYAFFHFIFISLFVNASFAQAALSNDAQISLLTCDPGSELYSTFGHTAIRVKDKKNGMDVAFNYGIFDFDTPGFYRKFLRGKLDYMLGAYPYDGFMREYRRDKRSVTEQILDLDSLQKEQVFAFLVDNAKEENRFYKYDFFFDNCSTRPRDVFQNILGLTLDKEPSEKTFRDQLDEFLPGLPWSDFGIDLVIGAVADQKASPFHQTFLPDYLMNALDNSDGLVANKSFIIDHSEERIKRFKQPIFTPSLVFGVLLLLELVLVFLYRTKKIKWIQNYDWAWFWVMGLSALLLIFMWFGTDHIATKQNWNLLWISPLYMVYLLAKNDKLKKLSLVTLMASTLLSLFFWPLIPQSFHHAFLPIMLIMMIKLIRSWHVLKSKFEMKA